MIRINLSEKELRKLYEDEKLSSRQIAKKLGCGKTTVLGLMKKYRILARDKKETGKMIVHPIKYKISKEELVDSYIKKHLSMGQIATSYGTTGSVICTKLKKHGIPSRTFEEGNKLSIPRRSKSIAKSLVKYKKTSFSGDDLEKSYLIGFRLGDLNVRKNKYGETLFVSCKSTRNEQIELIKNLFEKYGSVKISSPHRDEGRQITCNLDLSFSFLLKKEDFIEDWILNIRENFISFLAGYIDAEGHFGLDRDFGEFAVGSYDKNIIKSIHQKLFELGIEGRLPRIGQIKGYIDKRGIRCNKDLWTFKITRKEELLKFINLIENNIKHQKRYKDMLNVKTNLLTRGIKLNVERKI